MARNATDGRATVDRAEEAQLALEIVEFSRRLVELGLLEFRGGNLSARVGESDMLITERRSSKGAAGVEDIIRVPIEDGGDGELRASSALEVHREIYRRTDARAVIHAHPPVTVSLSFFLDELVPIDENGLLYLRPRVSCVAPPTLFGWNLVAGEMADKLIEEKVVIQKWHGTFAKGSDLGEAFHRTRAVEFMSGHLVRVAQLAEHFGDPVYPPTEVAEVIGGLPVRDLAPVIW